MDEESIEVAAEAGTNAVAAATNAAEPVADAAAAITGAIDAVGGDVSNVINVVAAMPDMAPVAAVGTGIALAVMIPLLLVGLIPALIMLVSTIKVFSKAGLPGIGAIVPIWNQFLFAKAAGKSWVFGLLLFVPVVNVVILIILSLGLAQQFNRGAGFGLGLFFLPIIFYPILAFGSSTHVDAAPAKGRGKGRRASAAGEPAAEGPGGRTPGKAPAGEPAKVGAYMFLALICALAFGALVGMQIVEYKHYEDPPNVWRVPLVPVGQ